MGLFSFGMSNSTSLVAPTTLHLDLAEDPNPSLMSTAVFDTLELGSSLTFKDFVYEDRGKIITEAKTETVLNSTSCREDTLLLENFIE